MPPSARALLCLILHRSSDCLGVHAGRREPVAFALACTETEFLGERSDLLDCFVSAAPFGGPLRSDLQIIGEAKGLCAGSFLDAFVFFRGSGAISGLHTGAGFLCCAYVVACLVRAHRST